MINGRERTTPGGSTVQTPDMNDQSPASKGAVQKCQGRLPLQPPEMDEAKNPHYLDDYHEWITCMNEHGVPVEATQPLGSGWTYSRQSTVPYDQERKIENDCKKAAFSK
ncbi:hypothetical protein LWC34_44810 [Kibdelosporangium philippinense]|uniref:Uncharacterized protein n=1 Tax=Kibdelosporangium philippinense TaxID=211113 RepID=A0ABS8ZSD0_9PSEU|nr:hypothetical protein [Kibdelosporangium philippinense]MCE7009880.1 hypothetical protein [Kibdelosporangium philippinense]